MINQLNILDKFAQINDYWHPRIVGELNGQYVKIAKLKGEFVWHDHQDEDELFMVVKGTLIMDYRDGTTTETSTGNILIIPKGIEHLPKTPVGEETWVILFEPKATKHTGDVADDRTKHVLEWL